MAERDLYSRDDDPDEGVQDSSPVVPSEDLVSRYGFQPLLIISDPFLNDIGFWEPVVQKRRRTIVTYKDVYRDAMHHGQVHPMWIRIRPSAELGYPTNIDLHIHLAFQRHLMDLLMRGPIENPVTTSGMKLLRYAEKPDTGPNHQEVARYFRVMKLTGIGAVTKRGGKTAERLVSVFNDVYQEGDRLPDGRIATSHTIMLADWYLNSHNQGNQILIDFHLFHSLSRPISELLYVMLHRGFVIHKGEASRRYRELMESWRMKTHSSYSAVRRQLDSAHEELKAKGFLKRWEYARLKDEEDYEIHYEAGQQFYDALDIQLREFPELHLPMQDPFFTQTIEAQQQLPLLDEESIQLLLQDLLRLLGTSEATPQKRRYWLMTILLFPEADVHVNMSRYRDAKSRDRVTAKLMTHLFKETATIRGIPWPIREQYIPEPQRRLIKQLLTASTIP